jgi:precorrin-6B methylase 2
MRIISILTLSTMSIVSAQTADRQTSDIPYVPTPPAVVEAMLAMASLGADDVLIDLGSGDGRIVIAAAKQFGARAIGVELDHALVRESRSNAVREHVSNKAEFVEGDLFRQDLHTASVVTLYLTPSVNLRLRPKLLKELAPGSRIVSHRFDMGSWRPDKTLVVDGETVFLWIVPRRTKLGAP